VYILRSPGAGTTLRVVAPGDLKKGPFLLIYNQGCPAVNEQKSDQITCFEKRMRASSISKNSPTLKDCPRKESKRTLGAFFMET